MVLGWFGTGCGWEVELDRSRGKERSGAQRRFQMPPVSSVHTRWALDDV